MSAVPTPTPLNPGSVNLAFDIARDSYDTTFRRVDALNDKILKFLAFEAAVSLAVLTLGVPRFGTRSPFLVLAMVAFVVSVTSSATAVTWGKVASLNPSKLNPAWLTAREEEFKVDFIRYAGVNHDSACRVLWQKNRFFAAGAASFVFEVVCLIVWVAGK